MKDSIAVHALRKIADTVNSTTPAGRTEYWPVLSGRQAQEIAATALIEIAATPEPETPTIKVDIAGAYAQLLASPELAGMMTELVAPTVAKTVEHLQNEIERLADFIMAEIPGEPSQSESAVDCAIHWMRSRLPTQPALAVKGLDPIALAHEIAKRIATSGKTGRVHQIVYDAATEGALEALALVDRPEPEAVWAATLTYRNYRGEISERTITPKRCWFGATEWHPEPQWLLTAYDHDKQADRDFALKDFGASIEKAEPKQPDKPEPFIIGNTYRTLAGQFVKFVKIYNVGTDYETMEDESGCNRYTKRDFGRVTGTSHTLPDPRNVAPLYASQQPLKSPGRVRVPEGQTPLDDSLGHPLLEVFSEGCTARNNGKINPYHGHSVEHCLYAAGWVQQDLRLALDKLKAATPVVADELKEMLDREERRYGDTPKAQEHFQRNNAKALEALSSAVIISPETKEALHNAKVLLRALTGPDDAIAQAALAQIDAVMTSRDEQPESATASNAERMFSIEWIAAPRPPVHPMPAHGRLGFQTFEQAMSFMKGLSADAQFVSLTERVTTTIDRTAEAQVELLYVAAGEQV